MLADALLPSRAARDVTPSTCRTIEIARNMDDVSGQRDRGVPGGDRGPAAEPEGHHRLPGSAAHLSLRSNWLRAAVLGANDGILSTSSLVLGIAASGAASRTIVVAGVAGMTAGALSMAAGEYVSVSSQRDAERADVRLERRQLSDDPRGELEELAAIYERRGLDRELAQEVADALTERDALGAHTRDELGLAASRSARPVQAAGASALAFAAGAILPLLAVAAIPAGLRLAVCATVTLLALALLGGLGARLGGAPKAPATVRAVVWGSAAMAITSGIGALVGSG
jgi:VIT1/CCC1 family predicted Fe2+/Mn2+ transporter